MSDENDKTNEGQGANTGGTPSQSGPRAPLSLAFSSDGGATFEVAGDLDEGDGYCLTNNSRDRLNRELSYPAIHQAPDGSLDVAYTWFRQTIKHVRIPAGWRQGA